MLCYFAALCVCSLYDNCQVCVKARFLTQTHFDYSKKAKIPKLWRSPTNFLPGLRRSDCRRADECNFVPLAHPPLVAHTHTHTLATLVTSTLSSMAPVQLSCQTKASYVDVKLAHSIRAWHLPNGRSLSGSSLCH